MITMTSTQELKEIEAQLTFLYPNGMFYDNADGRERALLFEVLDFMFVIVQVNGLYHIKVTDNKLSNGYVDIMDIPFNDLIRVIQNYISCPPVKISKLS